MSPSLSRWEEGRLSRNCFEPVGCVPATTGGRLRDHLLSDDGGSSGDPHSRSSWAALALGVPPADSLAGHRGMDLEPASLPGHWRSRHPQDPGSSQPFSVVETR